MKARIILVALLLVVGLTTAAWADGRIWGYINYHNCNPDQSDQVCIRPVSGGDAVWTGSVILTGGPHYNTYPQYLIPPGNYYIEVLLHSGSDCGITFIQTLAHGYLSDRCDLLVEGTDPGSSPQPGP
jgi:hypothetical protein